MRESHEFRVRFSHGSVFIDLCNVQKSVTQSYTLGHCLVHIALGTDMSVQNHVLEMYIEFNKIDLFQPQWEFLNLDLVGCPTVTVCTKQSFVFLHLLGTWQMVRPRINVPPQELYVQGFNSLYAPHFAFNEFVAPEFYFLQALGVNSSDSSSL